MGTATSSAFPPKFQPTAIFVSLPRRQPFLFLATFSEFWVFFFGSQNGFKYVFFSGFLVAKFLQLFLKYHQISLFWAIVCR
jgi:hypothetical protein